MTSNRKRAIKGDVHSNILQRAEKLSKSGSKVFDKDGLKADEGFLLRESRRLGLSQKDIKEIMRVSTEETALGGANLPDQIALFESTLDDFVEGQKLFIQHIESQRKELMELTRDRIERELIESCWSDIISNVKTNIVKESTFVNTKLQVSKKQHSS